MVVVIDVKHYNEETDEYEWIIDLSDFYGKDVDLEWLRVSNKDKI